jgi:hypothetical protein
MARRQRRTSEPATAEAQEAGPCSDQELEAARVVDAGGELLLQLGTAIAGALQDQGVDVPRLISSVLARLQCGQPSASVDGDEKARILLLQWRQTFIEADYDEMPYLRVVGKVVEVLTVHRRASRKKDYCTSGDVFRVFLTEIPQHSLYDPADYRLARPTTRGNQFALARDPGKTMFSDRLKDLKKKRLLVPATATRGGGERGYRLSNVGRLIFDGWPEVDGLHNAPPPPPATE